MGINVRNRLDDIQYNKFLTNLLLHNIQNRQGTLETLLQEMGVEDIDEDVEIISERRVTGFSTLEWIIGRAKVEAEDPRTLKIANIGREVINSARRYIRKNLDDAVEKAKENIDGLESMRDDKLARKLLENGDVALWAASLERLEGAQLEVSEKSL
jgi:hypothetical protein